MGILPWDFEELSLLEFTQFRKGYLIRDAKRQEPLRMLYFALSNGFLKKGKSFAKIKDEWPLYTDGLKEDGAALTEEQMRSTWELLNK